MENIKVEHWQKVENMWHKCMRRSRRWKRRRRADKGGEESTYKEEKVGKLET